MPLGLLQVILLELNLMHLSVETVDISYLMGMKGQCRVNFQLLQPLYEQASECHFVTRGFY